MTKAKNKVVIKKELCKACELCILYCKKSVLKSSDDLNLQGYHYAEPDDNMECTGCLVCTLVCPEVAIEIYGE